MKILKNILILCLTAVLIIGMLACSKGAKDGKTAKLDPDAQAFRLGDLEATAGELNAVYNSFVNMMQQYGMPPPANDEEIKTYVDMALDQLIATYSILWKADEMGVSLSSAKQDEIDATINTHRQEILDDYINSVMSEAGEEAGNPADFEDQALAKIDVDIKAFFGEDMTFNKYLEDSRKELKNEAIVEEVKAAVVSGETVTEEDIRGWFESQLETYEEAYNEAPIEYKTFMMQYEMGTSPVPPLVVPEGFARVALITVAPEDTIDESYTTNKETMKALEAEYGKLMLEGSADATRLKEIKDEYAPLKTDTDAVYQAFSEGPKARAEEAHGMLSEGTDFDTVMGKFNKEENKEEMLLYLKDKDSSVPEAVWNAVNKLEEGEYSGIIEVEGTFYIVKLLEHIPAGPVPLADVMEQARAAALLERQETVWEQRQVDWLGEAKEAVEYYEANYAMVGKV